MTIALLTAICSVAAAVALSQLALKLLLAATRTPRPTKPLSQGGLGSLRPVGAATARPVNFFFRKIPSLGFAQRNQ